MPVAAKATCLPFSVLLPILVGYTIKYFFNRVSCHSSGAATTDLAAIFPWRRKTYFCSICFYLDCCDEITVFLVSDCDVGAVPVGGCPSYPGEADGGVRTGISSSGTRRRRSGALSTLNPGIPRTTRVWRASLPISLQSSRCRQRGPTTLGMPSATEYLSVTYDLDCTDASTDLFGCPASSITPDVSSSSLIYVDCPNDCPQSPALDGHTCRICSNRIMDPASNCGVERSEYVAGATLATCTNAKLSNASMCSSCYLPAMQPTTNCGASKYECRLRDSDDTVGRRGYFECRPGPYQAWSVVLGEFMAASRNLLTDSTLALSACALAFSGASAYARRQLVDIATSSYFKFKSCPGFINSLWDCDFEPTQVASGTLPVKALFLECQPSCANAKLDPFTSCALCIDRSLNPATKLHHPTPAACER